MAELSAFNKAQSLKILGCYNTNIEKSIEKQDLEKGGPGSGKHKVGDSVTVAVGQNHPHSEFNKRTGKIVSTDNGNHTVEFISKDSVGDNKSTTPSKTGKFNDDHLIAKSDDDMGDAGDDMSDDDAQ